jgi:hypothetical protein
MDPGRVCLGSQSPDNQRQNLTWEQFNEVAPNMIALMKENDWPDNRIDMHISFWSALQNHHWRHDFDDHKQHMLLLYKVQQ